MKQQATQFTVPQTVVEHRARLKKAKIGNYNIAYVDEGPRDGEVIVFVHGMPTNSWLWRKIIPQLTAVGLRVIAPDLLGFGASDKPANPSEYTLERQSKRIIALLDQLGIQKWTQVAHDLGGPWTWEVIDRATERIQRLIILNTSAYREGFNPPAMVKMMATPIGPMMLGMMSNKVTGPFMVGTFFRTFTGNAAVIDKDAVEGYWLPLNEGTTLPFRQFVGDFENLYAQFDRYHAAFRRLNVPVLIIWGKKDQVVNVTKLAPQFAADLRISQENIHIFEDANHFLAEDKADAIAEKIKKFMGK